MQNRYFTFMAKNNRQGQASVWTKNVITKMRSLLSDPHHRLIFNISLYTGERISAITQLRVIDIWDSQGRVRDEITFGGATRKASKHGTAQTRQVPIHKDLRDILLQYDHPRAGYLFPSRSASGHITSNAVDKYWRRRLLKLGFEGFSTHSSRRWVINSLREAGVEISIIAETMKISIATVRRYLDDDPALCRDAINSLSV